MMTVTTHDIALPAETHQLLEQAEEAACTVLHVHDISGSSIRLVGEYLEDKPSCLR